MNQTTREKAVSRCVEEAALLWLRREHLIGEPHLSLPDLADRDRQLQARLDELLAAGELGWRACQRELGWEEPGEIFPATLLALAENSPNRLTRVLDYAIRSYELSPLSSQASPGRHWMGSLICSRTYSRPTTCVSAVSGWPPPSRTARCLSRR